MEKIYLFNGKDLNNWHYRDGSAVDWIVEDGVMTVNHGNITCNETYRDAHIHVEFKLPYVENVVHYQLNGNSGVYIHGCYELQVLNSSQNGDDLGNDECGAIYSVAKPLMNACKGAEEWQSYDIIFRAPRYENGEMTENARVTILLNGLPVQNNLVLVRATPGGVCEHIVEEGPLLLQDHGEPVQFRNIWMMHLPEKD